MGDRLERLRDLAEEHGPCSVRHVFYQAVVSGVSGVTKDASGYHKVQRAILKMRRDGQLDYRAIVDTSRTYYGHETHSDAASFLFEMANLYRRDLWLHSPWKVEVWAESESIASTIRDVTEEWRVPLFPTRGHSSESYAYNAVTSWSRAQTPVVLYIGDHDPAGLDIETNLREKLSRFATERGVTHPVWERIGVTWEQVVEGDLPGTQPKRPYGYPLSVEAEALPPKYLRSLLWSAISARADASTVSYLKAIESEEREGLMDLAFAFEPGGE